MYPGEYQLVGIEMSFFTRKLAAHSRFQHLLRAGAAGDPKVQDLFAGRGILEHYLN